MYQNVNIGNRNEITQLIDLMRYVEIIDNVTSRCQTFTLVNKKTKNTGDEKRVFVFIRHSSIFPNTYFYLRNLRLIK